MNFCKVLSLRNAMVFIVLVIFTMATVAEKYEITQEKSINLDAHSKIDYPSVENLDEFLKPFEENRCLVGVTSFHTINIPSHRYPIIIRNFVAMVSNLSLLHEYSFKKRTNEWNSNNDKSKCHNSNLFNEFDNCLSLSYSKFSVSSKPWACQLDLSLYFKLEASKSKVYPSLVSYNYGSLPEFYNFTASLAPKITVLVQYHSKEANRQATTTSGQIDQIFKSVSTRMQPSLTFPIYAVSFVTRSSTQDNKLSHAKGNIIYAFVLRFQQFYSNGTSRIKVQNWTLELLAKLAFPNPSETIFWVGRFESNYEFPSDLIDYLRSCKNRFKGISKLAISYKRSVSSPTKLVHAYAHLFRSIWKNYTFVIYKPDTQSCENDEKIWIREYRLRDFVSEKRQPLIFGIYAYSERVAPYDVFLSVPNKLGTLKFVVCGLKGISAYDLKDFVSIFDSSVWTIFVILIIILSLQLTWLDTGVRNNNSNAAAFIQKHVKNLLSLIKLFLEQGDPFSKAVLKLDHASSILVGLFLGSIVLSNSFKNSNVYNIILPKRPVTYDKLLELVAENFTIYTRSSSFVELQKSNDIVSGRHKLYDNYSELIVESEVSMYSNLYKASNEKEKSNIFLALNHSFLHGNVNSLLHESTKQRNQFFRLGLSFSLDPFESLNLKWSDYVIKDFKKKEEKVLYSELVKCQKTALILPEYLSQSFASRARRKTGQYMSVGKEKYASLNLAFRLEGAVPIFILQWFSGIKQSVLFLWWESFIGKRWNPEFHSDKFLVKTSMDGNILAIFLILEVGILVAAIGLLLELVYSCFFD